jgi:serine/threonine protein kinase
MTKRAAPWGDAWKVERRLGGGGQGNTWLVCSCNDTTQRGVLKTLRRNDSAEARGRMRIEVASLAFLAKQGAKVPRVLAANVEQADDPDLELFFVMEYIPGRALSEVIRERGRLPLEQVAAVTLGLCATVSLAHKNRILHRDLKPDNIIVRDLDKADLVIVDFGLSFNEDEAEETLTQFDEQMRNRFLALPETNVAGGDRRDHRSDVTALAAIFSFCLTGHEPGQLRDGRGLPPHRRMGTRSAPSLGATRAVTNLSCCLTRPSRLSSITGFRRSRSSRPA